MNRMLEDGSTLEISQGAYDAAINHHEWATQNQRHAKAALDLAEEILRDAEHRLALQEDRPGIPLWNRCPSCKPDSRGSVYLPVNHDGECRS